ncbi:sporulation protein YpjB [Bacillus sp. FJAT-45037]|uniref:sporulation protein YpjB n=1 Tax=Bacillus sp. FJAT-45037 TaxID=2011007 RepID=UPI000C24FCBE|nr:sporulation protein YpjB [Bacillus sp. FJAT-45037]
MRQVFVLILSFCILFGLNGVGHATEVNGQHTWKDLNQTTDQVLQLVKQEKFEEAKQLLDYFSDSFVELDFKQEGLTMNEMRTITLAFESAVEAVTSSDLALDQRIYAVTSFRLAVDAISSEHHPLWLQSEQSIMQGLHAIKEEYSNHNNQALQQRMNTFLRHYQMIRPALLIDLEPQTLQQLESQVMYLDSLRIDGVNTDKIVTHIERMESDFGRVFERVKEDSADPSLLWVMFTIGGMILLSLSYVGVKKYRAEKSKVRMKE